MPDLLFFLLLGHFVGDFVLQSDRVAQQKRASATVLSGHVLVYTLSVAICLCIGLMLANRLDLFTVVVVMLMIGLYIEHWVQDYVRSRWFSGGKQSLYIDQFIHIMILLALRIYVFNV